MGVVGDCCCLKEFVWEFVGSGLCDAGSRLLRNIRFMLAKGRWFAESCLEVFV